MRPLTPDYAVSPQIAPEDMPAIAEAGFRTVLNNRPDHENPPALQSPAMRAAAEAAGLTYLEVPADSRAIGPGLVAEQSRALETAPDGPVLAYCASGTRSAILWALGQAGRMETDEIIAALADAGYPLDGLRPTLEAMAAG